MQTLTMMTLAALALGGATYAVDTAFAQTPVQAPVESAACESRTVSIYFGKGEADVDAFSREIVERIAAEARTCGAGKVLAEAPAGPLAAEREAALSGAFADEGVKVILVGASPLARKAAGPDAVSSRTASIRIASSIQQVG